MLLIKAPTVLQDLFYNSVTPLPPCWLLLIYQSTIETWLWSKEAAPRACLARRENGSLSSAVWRDLLLC